jgi:hypothetical protein
MTTPKSDLHWFSPTPGRLLVLLLGIEVVIFFSRGLFPKGVAILIAVGILVLFLTFILQCILYQWSFREQPAKPNPEHRGHPFNLWTFLIFVLLPLNAIFWYPELRKNYVGLVLMAIVGMETILLLVRLIFHVRPQYSLRTLLIVVTLFACVCSGFAVMRDQAKRQREAVDALRKNGCRVLYDCQYRREQGLDPPGPDGDDYTDEIAYVSIRNKEANNQDLQHLKVLNKIRILDLSGVQVTDDDMESLSELSEIKELYLDGTQISDSGLKYLEGLKNMRYLSLSGTEVSSKGIDNLKKALPQLKVNH